MPRAKNLIELAKQKAIVVEDIVLQPSDIHPTDAATSVWRIVLTCRKPNRLKTMTLKRGPFPSREAAENILNGIRARFGLLQEA